MVAVGGNKQEILHLLYVDVLWFWINILFSIFIKFNAFSKIVKYHQDIKALLK